VATLIVPRPDPESLNPTLGQQVCDFIEDRAVFGPGSLQEQSAKLDAEKKMFIYRMYEVYPKGHRLEGNRVFERCAVELRKGLAKTEFAAWVAFCELHPEAPVRFDGWDANGDPVGRPVSAPYIPLMAAAEEQVMELAFGVLTFIIQHSPDASIFDCSKERIVRLSRSGTNDGVAVPVSNAPNTRDGARTTFQHFDEPHRLTLPRERHAHETMLQNLPKRQIESPWALYTSTAGNLGQGSIEEDVRAEAEAIAEGKLDNKSFFFFARWAGDEHQELDTLEKRVAAVADATGPVGEWGLGQFDRIARDYDRVGIDRMYWERVYLNRWRKSGSAAFDMNKVKDLVQDSPIERGAFVSVGFDGARRKDSTAIVITEIDSGRQQLVALWERPEDAQEWEIDSTEVDDVFADIMRDFEVWRAYCDPPYWIENVAHWAGKWPDQVVEWWTNRQRPAAYMVRAYAEAIDGQQISFVGPMRDELVRHIGHAGRKDLKINDDEGQPLWILQKQDGQLMNKFDACMAANLSWQARLDALAVGARPAGRVGAPRRLY
jgi:hypothetical protein